MLLGHLYTLVFSHAVNMTSGPGVKVSNELACAQLCLEKYDCSSFFYNSDTKTCLASTKRYFYPKGLHSDYGFKYYGQRTDCGSRWLVLGGQCYIAVDDWNDADDSRIACERLGGFLAKTDSVRDDVIIKSITSKRKHITIYQTRCCSKPASLYDDRGKFGFQCYSATRSKKLWLGGKENSKGELLWLDGSPITLDLWDPYRLKRFPYQRCIHQRVHGWQYRSCRKPLPFLCEK